MGRITHVFTGYLEDEYGSYPDALIVIGETIVKYIEIENSDGINTEYREEIVIESFGYYASYYNSRDMQLRGKRSRPIVVGSDGGKTRIIEVDMNNQEVINLIDSGVKGPELKVQMIELDIKIKFS